MKAENKESCLQRDSAEHKGYAGAQSNDNCTIAEVDGADLMERILGRDNMNRAFSKVKSNKGATGVDGMTIDDAAP